MSDLVPIESIADKIHLIRGHKVMLNSDHGGRRHLPLVFLY